MKKIACFFIAILFFFGCKEDDLLNNDSADSENEISNKNIGNNSCVESTNKYDFPKADFVETRPSFLWGINGHALTPNYPGYENQYNSYTFEQQIELLKELNLDVYRIWMHADEGGIWNESGTNLIALTNLLNANGIKPLVTIGTNLWRNRYAPESENQPVFIGRDWNYIQVLNYLNNPSQSVQIQNLDLWEHYYTKAKLGGINIGSNYGGNIKYYNIGNEMARYLVSHFKLPGCAYGDTDWECIRNYFFATVGSGDEIEDYFTSEEHAKRMISLAAYTKGFIDGIRQEDQDAKFIVNETEMFYGYHKFLNQMNVEFDIIGWNWYSGLGSFTNNNQGINVYENLQTIANGRDIWITEINKTMGSYYGEVSQANEVRSLMQEIYGLDQVKAFLVYQLLDQKYGQAPVPYENYFGLIRAPFPSVANATYKPAYNTYRFSIEEFRYGYHDLIYSYYLKYKNEDRPIVGDSGIDLWAGYLTNGSNWGNILNNIIDEDSRYFVQTTFDLLLNRPASPSDISYYIGQMSQQNKTREWFISNVGSSIEFFNNAQSAPYNNLIPPLSNSVKFIRHAYKKLVDEFPDTQELNAALAYSDLPTNQTSRAAIITQILNSNKYKVKFINEQFSYYLERPAQQSDINGYINNWNGQKSLIKSLLMSDEFWRQSVVRGYCVRQNL